MARKNGNLTGERQFREEQATVGIALTGMLPLLPLWIGLALILTDTLPSVDVPWWSIALMGLIFSAALFVLHGTPVQRWVLLGGLVITAGACVVFRAQLFSGMQTIVNDILTKLTDVNGRIHLKYEAAGNVIPALILLSLFLALLFTAAAMKGWLLPLLPILLPLVAGTALGIVRVNLGWLLLAAGVVLLAGSGGQRSARVSLGRLAVALVCAALAILISLPLQNAELSGLRTSALRRVHALQYDSETNSMPEGRLSDLGPRTATDAAALEVTMEEPQKLYLRGHIYETYTGTAWEPVDPAQLARSEPLFYWLHESGFYGQSQIALATALETGEAPREVSVRNLSACSENAYLPYALASSDGLDAALIGDTRTDSGVDSFPVYTGSIPQWYETQYLLAHTQASPEAREYLALEEGYRQFVQDTDLQMTQESRNVLYRQLGDSEGSRSLDEILQSIRSYLDEHMHYAEAAYTLNGTGDFLHYVLESSDGSGYSVHYATAAALMLRYFGVPSRYVEGYYLTPEQAKRASAGETVLLTEKNAHAWAEYYLNGVGFVPFEVTPGYVDPADLRIDTECSTGSGSVGGLASGSEAPEDESGLSLRYQADSVTYTRTESPEPEIPHIGQKDETRLSAWKKLLLTLLALAVLALLVGILLIRLRLRRKLREIDDAPDKEAVAMRYGYAMALRERAPALQLPEDAQAALLNERALFSPREMTRLEREEMDRYTLRVLDACKETWTLPQKLKLRLIEGIY